MSVHNQIQYEIIVIQALFFLAEHPSSEYHNSAEDQIYL